MSEQSGAGAGTVRALATQLAQTLGWDKSVEVVADAARRLGFKDGELGPDERRAILEDLSLEPGIVGVTARYIVSRTATSRSDRHTITIPPSSPRPSLIAPPPSSEPRGPTPSSVPSIPPDSSAAVVLSETIGVHEVVSQLVPLMGSDKADTVVKTALRRLALPRERLDREQVTRLFDDLGRQEGHTGITARFVRSRVMAKFQP